MPLIRKKEKVYYSFDCFLLFPLTCWFLSFQAATSCNIQSLLFIEAADGVNLGKFFPKAQPEKKNQKRKS